MILPKVGDRIELVKMPDDPCPIEPGAQGTVLLTPQLFEDRYQIHVDWDNKRTLSLVVPPDEFLILPPVSMPA